MSIESKFKINYPLSELTTFKIGGPAKYFFEPDTKEELISSLDWAEKEKVKIYILGGLSNVLINDQGIDGLVLKINNKELKIKGERMECGAGLELGQAVIAATGAGLTGLEWATGIPGSIGGAVRGNAGAFGLSIGQIVETVEVINLKTHTFSLLSKNDCHFLYRNSLIKEKPEMIIWKIDLRLSKGDPEKIKAKSKECLEHRINTQPKLPSAGCIFKNFEAEIVKDLSPELYQKAENSGIIRGGKIAAGWVISQLDLGGKNLNDAKISLEHKNFIVNTKNASADDVAMLIGYIKQQVRDNYNINLQEEIEYIGF